MIGFMCDYMSEGIMVQVSVRVTVSAVGVNSTV